MDLQRVEMLIGSEKLARLQQEHRDLDTAIEALTEAAGGGEAPPEEGAPPPEEAPPGPPQG